MPGVAFTLDASGGRVACRQGVGTRQSRWACPRSQSGKNGRGMQTKRLPKRSAEPCAAIYKEAPPRARPIREETGKLLPADRTARSPSPVLAHALQDVLPVSRAPHGVACNHMVGSASHEHHAKLHISTHSLRVYDVADALRHAPERGGFKGAAARQPSPKPPVFLNANKTMAARQSRIASTSAPSGRARPAGRGGLDMVP